MKKKVLFICTHNSARSQMAEGLLRAMYSGRFEAFSAGTQPAGVNPFTVKAMAELGIDISSHRSKSVKDFLEMEFDYVITVCDHAKETCPVFLGGKEYIHKSFEDPSGIEGTEGEKMAAFRRVRDEIAAWLKKKFD